MSNGFCVPCKEELCNQLLQGYLRSGSNLTARKRLNGEALDRWVSFLDRATKEAHEILMGPGGPVEGSS